MQKQRRRSLRSALLFSIQILQSLCFLNPIFQASSHLLWLYSQISAGPGLKPRRQVFLRHGLYFTFAPILMFKYSNIFRSTCTVSRHTTQADFYGQFFGIFQIKLFCFVNAITDLVHTGIFCQYIWVRLWDPFQMLESMYFSQFWRKNSQEKNFPKFDNLSI